MSLPAAVDRLAHADSDTSPDPRYGVLVADDDPVLRALLSAVLERDGFRVWLAEDGAAAVELFARYGPAVDVVLLDVRMPVLDGPNALAAVQALRPGVPCCFMSGFTAEYSEEELCARGAKHIFDKPFKLDEVNAVLRHIAGSRRLGQRRSGEA